MDNSIEISPLGTAIYLGIAIVLIIIGLIKRDKDNNSGGGYIVAGIIVTLLGTVEYIIKGLSYLLPVVVIFTVIWAIINWKKF